MFLRTRTPRDPKNVQRYNKFMRFANKLGFFLLFLLKGDVFLLIHQSFGPKFAPKSAIHNSSNPSVFDVGILDVLINHASDG